MLGHLADQAGAVPLGHPVPRLDPLVGGDQLGEAPLSRLLVRGGIHGSEYRPM